MSKGFASSYRIVLLAACILLGFAGLGARLIYLHVIIRDELVQSVDKARRQIIVETARRGDILDAKGSILATSRTLIVLGVDPQALRKEDEKKWPQLAQLLGVPLPELARTLLTKSRPAVVTNASSASSPAKSGDLVINFPLAAAAAKSSTPAVVSTEAPVDDTVVDDNVDENGMKPIRWAKLSETVEESTYAQIQALEIKGVYGQRAYRRAYPHNSLAAHIIGFVNKQGEPVAGIERYADFYLHGRDGWREGERDGLRRELAQFRTRDVPASDGFNVRLSIDSTIQHMVEEELDMIVKKFAPQKATIIVSDPQTGFILALANAPTFNLNEYNQVAPADQAAMRNAAVSDMYEPGSVFKIVAASAALNEGLVTAATRFDCSIDKIDYKGMTRSLPKEDHNFDEPLSVAEIVSHSSNRGAAQLAMKLGDERFYAYARAFGFGQVTGFPVGGEIGGWMATPAKWDGLTITRMPMGQSVTATPLQMQMAMSVIASGGYLLRPQVIRQITDASGEVVYRYSGVAKQRVITNETARTMARLLMGVVSDKRTRYGAEGTAPEAAIPNYEVAGKTGTSQKYLPETMASGRVRLMPSTRHHVASFVGFFPASRPQVVISVIVDDADAKAPGGVAYGKTVAAPSFKHLGEQLIQYLDIKPVYDPTAHPALAMEGRPPVIGYLTHDYPLIHAFQPRPAHRSREETLSRNRVFKMAPKLSDYFADGEIVAQKGSLDRPISGLVIDSRRVVPGNLFFALPGLRADGVSYIDEAVSRGAVAIVAQKLPAHAQAKVTFIEVKDARAMLARVAQRYYKFPDRAMTVVGVTGTNGKTTVTHLIKHLLNGDQKVGLIGTINYDLGARTVPSYRTTPESLDIYGMMAQMRDAGCKQAVMEVSSHGIDQQRVLGLQFGAAVFTNLTRDHLDYHKTLDAYFAVKTKLFTGATGSAPKVAVVNLDDPYGDKLVANIPAGVKIITFGENPRALVRAENVALHFKNSTFRLVWPGGTLDLDSPLIGRYNVSNLLAAIATAWGLGRDPVVFLARLRAFGGVAGRMERIEEGQPFNVLVDYAHTDDALHNALGMLRAITPGKLLVVFGCGGNRDRTKRPLMVKAVQEFADFAFATADNPRSEALTQIFSDMKAGVTAPATISWTEDRRRAISLALDAAQPGDSLLIAGKGHESYQEFADTVIPFDDRQVVRELIAIKTLKNA